MKPTRGEESRVILFVLAFAAAATVATVALHMVQP